MQATSLAANTASKPNREYNYDRILKALDMLPNNEGIADNIAAYTTIDKIEVSRRMGELAAKGKVFDTGRKGITAKGCKAILWKLVKEPVGNPQQSLFE
jgi:hypothetical protein